MRTINNHPFELYILLCYSLSFRYLPLSDGKKSINTLRIGLFSVSERAANGIYQDQGLSVLEAWLGKVLTTPFEIEKRLVPDK